VVPVAREERKSKSEKEAEIALSKTHPLALELHDCLLRKYITLKVSDVSVSHYENPSIHLFMVVSNPAGVQIDVIFDLFLDFAKERKLQDADFWLSVSQTKPEGYLHFQFKDSDYQVSKPSKITSLFSSVMAVFRTNELKKPESKFTDSYGPRMPRLSASEEKAILASLSQAPDAEMAKFLLVNACRVKFICAEDTPADMRLRILERERPNVDWEFELSHLDTFHKNDYIALRSWLVEQDAVRGFYIRLAPTMHTLSVFIQDRRRDPVEVHGGKRRNDAVDEHKIRRKLE